MKRIARFLIPVFLFGVVAAGAAYLWFEQQYDRFLESPLALPETGFILQIEQGTPASAIIHQLDTLGYTESSWPWKVLMRLEPPDIRTGEFRLNPGLRPRELLQLLSSEKVVHYRFTIVEGWTFNQLLEALANDEVLTSASPGKSAVQPQDVLPELDIDHPEGWFLPETYLFIRGDTPADILQRSHRAMKSALDDAWREREDDLPLNSPYELLILASIIEKETAIDSERNELAGVFIRRLRSGMRLQTDPTVIYGLGENFDGDIRRKDLRTDTPYNTYTRFGLPPTPIALPGRASLFAAGQPDDGDSLFFVANGQGGHTFSRTLEEHQKAVNKLTGKGQ